MNSGLVRVMNCFTVDIEDWYQGLVSLPREKWGYCEDRTERNTEKILSLLSEFRVQATFFVLGCVAERHPELIRKIEDSGHEIAVHGYDHRFIYNQTEDEFEKDIVRTLGILKKICHHEIEGYRAPFFSIRRDSLWALEVLCRRGIKYDSSIYPVYSPFFGVPGFPRFPHKIILKEFNLIEYPPSTARILGCNIPFAGGFFFRVLPYRFIRYGLRALNAGGHPGMVYLHPFDIDPDMPEVQGLSRFWKFVHYYSPGNTEKKLRKMLEEFSFTSVRNLMQGNQAFSG